MNQPERCPTCDGLKNEPRLVPSGHGGYEDTCRDAFHEPAVQPEPTYPFAALGDKLAEELAAAPASALQPRERNDIPTGGDAAEQEQNKAGTTLANPSLRNEPVGAVNESGEGQTAEQFWQNRSHNALMISVASKLSLHQCKDLDDEIVAYGRDFAATQVSAALADMQKHRDTWREYAYGNRDKPMDFLDGNKVNRGQTKLEKLEAALSVAPYEPDSQWPCHICGCDPCGCDGIDRSESAPSEPKEKKS